jgi:cell division protein FtsI (penicillin-binding protein 3)
VTRPPARRLVILLVVLLLGFGGIFVRLASLQIRDGSEYQNLAFEQRVRSIPLPARRGSILDRTRQEFALSLDARDVYADPGLIRHPYSAAHRIAPILGLPDGELIKDFSEDTRFVYVARQVDLDTVARLDRLGLPGIGFLNSSKRYYPNGSVASQVIGFVGVDQDPQTGAPVSNGLGGLELEYDKQLAGRPGERVVEIDPSGHLIPQGVNQDQPPVEGDDLVTTIDSDIQYQAQNALLDAVYRNHAAGGSVIVMDPHSGDVLAMASYPWFDPNNFQDYGEDSWRNRSVTDVYELGSVNKVITASGAVEEHVVPLDEQFYVPDSWKVSVKIFHDAERHHPKMMTLADIIARSSNVGTIRIAARLGMDRMAEYLAKFGLGQPTGIGFPGEEEGILPPEADWYGTSMGTIPVGQGVAVTPLQMISVYATIANGGMWVPPNLVKGLIDPDGTFVPKRDNRPERQVVSERTAKTITRILAYAVDAGTGHRAQIPGYWVAGKTGTAQKPSPYGGYLPHKYVASFIGFLPASNPRVVIAAILDEPETEYGGVAAAPLFREVARYAIARLRIPPAPKPEEPPHVLPFQY